MARQRDPGGKLTVFGVMSLAGAMAGAWLGAWLGMKVGWPIAVIGGIVGWVTGLLPGRLIGDYGVMALARELNGQDTTALRERLKREYFLAHLIVLVLVQRGEPRGPLIDELLEMLLDDDAEKRWSGWRAIGLNFPEVAASLEGIDPQGAPAVYRERVEEIRASILLEDQKVSEEEETNG